jgi:hypothetical protein
MATMTTAVPVRRRRLFYVGFATALALTAFVGFGPTYFFKPVVQSPPLRPLAHVHALLFTSWIVLLLVQTTLVSVRRTDVHQKLGWIGVALAVLMVPVGAMLAIDSAGHGLAPPAMDPLTFMAIPLGALVLFTGFLTGAIAMRRRPALHKRLMLLATISIITPAIARFGFIGFRPLIALGLTGLFVLAAIANDWRTDRRVHPVYIWGGLLILVSGPLRIAIGRTEMWHAFARMLVF